MYRVEVKYLAYQSTSSFENRNFRQKEPNDSEGISLAQKYLNLDSAMQIT
mgnify:CR=1 FL=1